MSQYPSPSSSATKTPPTLTTRQGAPVDSLTASQTAGPPHAGPLLLQDFVLLDHLAAFDRERIPERVVHAKGGGAFGYFEVTHAETLGPYCRAPLFQKAGNRVPVAVRFSTVGGESGSADTARDPRGFAIKFYTDQGIWDLVGNNTPIFFLRDPMLFPSFIHTQKRNPSTHLADPDAFWDFISLRPESLHQVSFLFGDRGTPAGYRHMNGYGSHTFMNVNADGQACYVKYHFKTDQGIANLTSEQASDLASSDTDFSTRDLYDAIAKQNYPSWTLYVQMMTVEQAKQVPFQPFDLTKIWPQADFPLQPVGRLVLNENPTDYFAQIEQLAFSPSHMIPGIEPSPDKMLQARLFSYPDTHRHRLGPNNHLIPVNRQAPSGPPGVVLQNYQRDGVMQVSANGGGGPNYFPNSFGGPQPDPQVSWHGDSLSGQVQRVDTGDEDNTSQVRTFYLSVLGEAGRDRLTTNIAGHLINAQSFLQERVVQVFGTVHPDYGRRITDKLRALKAAGVVPPVKIQPARLHPPRTVAKPRCPYGYSSKL